MPRILGQRACLLTSFCWYLLHLPSERWPGWVDLSGWFNTCSKSKLHTFWQANVPYIKPSLRIVWRLGLRSRPRLVYSCRPMSLPFLRTPGALWPEWERERVWLYFQMISAVSVANIKDNNFVYCDCIRDETGRGGILVDARATAGLWTPAALHRRVTLVAGLVPQRPSARRVRSDDDHSQNGHGEQHQGVVGHADGISLPRGRAVPVPRRCRPPSWLRCAGSRRWINI